MKRVKRLKFETTRQIWIDISNDQYSYRTFKDLPDELTWETRTPIRTALIRMI